MDYPPVVFEVGTLVLVTPKRKRKLKASIRFVRKLQIGKKNRCVYRYRMILRASLTARDIVVGISEYSSRH